MADSDSDDEKLDFVKSTAGADSLQIEEDDDDDEVDETEEEPLIQIEDIRYLIKASSEPQTVGPITYEEFKRHYNDPNVQCDKLTHIWNGLEIAEPTPLWKLDRIFKDIDPEKYESLQKMQESKSKQSGQESVNKNGMPLAEAMTISEMKAREAEEERQRLKNPQDSPILEQEAKYTSYSSGTCCTVL